MGGRKKIYDDISPLAEERTVATWLRMLRDRQSETIFWLTPSLFPASLSLNPNRSMNF
jgi:hypothetical protein